MNLANLVLTTSDGEIIQSDTLLAMHPYVEDCLLIRKTRPVLHLKHLTSTLSARVPTTESSSEAPSLSTTAPRLQFVPPDQTQSASTTATTNTVQNATTSSSPRSINSMSPRQIPMSSQPSKELDGAYLETLFSSSPSGPSSLSVPSADLTSSPRRIIPQVIARRKASNFSILILLVTRMIQLILKCTLVEISKQSSVFKQIR